MSTVLEEAEGLVNGQRQQDYGPPSINLERIADLWTALLPVDRRLTINDVCIAMTALKLARMASTKPQRDSIVDSAGYLRLMEMCDITLREGS